MKEINYYQILKVDYNADINEIKKSYYKLLKKFHPDVYKKDDAHEITILINQAYAVLSDEASRRNYDSKFFGQNYLDQDFDNFFENYKSDAWEEGRSTTSVFDKIYGFNNRFNETTTSDFNNSDFRNTKTFWNNYDDSTEFSQEYQDHNQTNRETKSWNDYFDNSFDIKIDRKIIRKYCQAFQIDWAVVLKILNESNLARKEIYLRCYYQQHFFDHYRLSAKQILAENVFKSVIVHSEDYQTFVKSVDEQKEQLNLSAKFYFDEFYLSQDFQKIIRYYRLYQCNFCQSTSHHKNNYCHFCFNKRYLKERMAVNIAWKKDQLSTKTIVYKNFGNRNENFMGDLILKLIPKKNFGFENSQMVIDYHMDNFSIDEIEENKII